MEVEVSGERLRPGGDRRPPGEGLAPGEMLRTAVLRLPESCLMKEPGARITSTLSSRPLAAVAFGLFPFEGLARLASAGALLLRRSMISETSRAPVI